MHDRLSPEPSGVRSSLPSPSTPAPARRATASRPEHAAFLEELYESWKLDPSSVDATWQSFFEGFELGCQTAERRRTSGPAASPARVDQPDPAGMPHRLKQARIYNLLFAYRTLGHQAADIDPLQFQKREVPELDFQHFKFTETDLDTVFDSGTLAGGGDRTLRETLEVLRETYCGKIGIEYMHIQNFSIRRWIRDKVESSRAKPRFSIEKKKRILNHILEAEVFERFLHTRYVGQKRFSLEGGETLIPMLDAVVEACPGLGISQVVMGMAHRGRLNVLANILGKNYRFLFDEFAENYIPETVLGDGDVKYHLGFEATVMTSGGERVGVSLAPNPSHLEAVDPVVQGKARAWQRLLDDTAERKRVVPLLLHGDAAFAAQGVVMETLNLSQLEGYRTGGTVHLVINNQIGFTTLPQDARSMVYCTGVAKMLGAPVFHVNGDDPLAAVYAVELALEFRQRFGRDVVVDLVCYRRHGHNEGDEPSFTQPDLYNVIRGHPPISEQLLKRLVAENDLFASEADQFRKKFEERLTVALAESKAHVQEIRPVLRQPLACPALLDPFHSGVDLEKLKKVGVALTEPPPTHRLHKVVLQLLKSRRAMALGEEPLDWSMAEALAFGTLLVEGVPVRLSGQDSRRGTFSQRHSVLYDAETRERYLPLMHVSPDQARFCVYNSPLSEYAVLGFDYGYSLDFPKALILWEAQFGDFVNGAQVIIDQYLTSAESKWGITSGLVLLLPHGYHGQGPEHSSARLERFLQACAEDNIIVANCSTPAQYFHILRRQGLRYLRRPLVLMTPKGLLRDKRCVSPVAALSEGRFEEILDDPAPPSQAKRVIFCSGKIFYDLAQHRDQTPSARDTAILRIEQLYPFHFDRLKALIEPYRSAEDWVWCQDESRNMGAWTFVRSRLRHVIGREVRYAGRDASASPATGSLALHNLEQDDLVRRAFQHPGADDPFPG